MLADRHIYAKISVSYANLTEDIQSMFKQLLDRAGIRKADLARRLGIKAASISKWKDDPPRYAVAYLELLIDYNRVRP